MKEAQLDILKSELGLELSPDTREKFGVWEKLFLDYNSHTNLMSKGDLALLFEKHIFDSLVLTLAGCFGAAGAVAASGGIKAGAPLKILDVGTGGGFPGLILAICFENIEVIAVDSTAKKINFINLAARKLGLKNIKPICARVEALAPQNVDIITSRAVGSMLKIYQDSYYHLKPQGKFIFYKADPRVYETEIQELQAFLGTAYAPKIINYILPTSEAHTRVLVIFSKPSTVRD